MADFQAHLDDLEDDGIRVVALSAEDEEDARRMVERHGLEFPVGYGVGPATARDRLGSWIDEERGVIHATGFLLTPEARVATAVYSTGAIGRLRAEEAAGVVAYLRG